MSNRSDIGSSEGMCMNGETMTEDLEWGMVLCIFARNSSSALWILRHAAQTFSYSFPHHKGQRYSMICVEFCTHEFTKDISSFFFVIRDEIIFFLKKTKAKPCYMEDLPEYDFWKYIPSGYLSLVDEHGKSNH